MNDESPEPVTLSSAELLDLIEREQLGHHVFRKPHGTADVVGIWEQDGRWCRYPVTSAEPS